MPECPPWQGKCAGEKVVVSRVTETLAVARTWWEEEVVFISITGAPSGNGCCCVASPGGYGSHGKGGGQGSKRAGPGRSPFLFILSKKLGFACGERGKMASPPIVHYSTMTLYFYGSSSFLHKHSQLWIFSLPSPQAVSLHLQESSSRVCSPDLMF